MYITGCIFIGTAWAASVYVKELGHGKAEVMINGSEARPMWVGEIVLTNVPGSVIEVGKQELPLVLIGMSFLSKVDMRHSGNTMLLQRRDY